MCPNSVEMTIGIESISRRASSGEAMWRQCAASFSTMMRHFQKAPSSFKWEADAERFLNYAITMSIELVLLNNKENLKNCADRCANNHFATSP